MVRPMTSQTILLLDSSPIFLMVCGKTKLFFDDDDDGGGHGTDILLQVNGL